MQLRALPSGGYEGGSRECGGLLACPGVKCEPRQWSVDVRYIRVPSTRFLLAMSCLYSSARPQTCWRALFARAWVFRGALALPECKIASWGGQIGVSRVSPGGWGCFWSWASLQEGGDRVAGGGTALGPDLG